MNAEKRTLIFGSGNKHKLSEIQPFLSTLPIQLKAAGEYGPFDPEENGSTLEENAISKAKAALELTSQWAFADDTGLEVDALNGEPGIYAARYAGPGCTFKDNIRKILKELEGVPVEKRTATFICVIALCRPNEEPKTFRGECLGIITEAASGENGFGYDPVFMPNSEKSEANPRVFAEMNGETKNEISHRGKAIQVFRDYLQTIL